MFTIAICEDNPSDSTVLQNMLDDYELANSVIFTVSTFTDAEALLGAFRAGKCRPDILLTEVLLHGMSGLELVRELRSSGFVGEVVFTTSSPDHALSAYELDARQYLVKPVDPARLFMTLEHILGGGKGSIVVREGRRLRKILHSAILYCETQGKYQIIHTKDEEIRVRITAREIKKLVPPPPAVLLIPLTYGKFAALGSAYLVNLCAVAELNDGRVIFDGGKELMLSRRKFSEVMKAVKTYRRL